MRWRRPFALEYIPRDGVVLSPLVEVFREGSDKGYPFFLQGPERLAAVIGVAMFNRNQCVGDAPLDAPSDSGEYEQVVREKFRSTLLAAKASQCTALVVPDVGCGVYRNDPRIVGRIFGEVLREEFRDDFQEVATCGGKEFQTAVKEAFDCSALAVSTAAHLDTSQQTAMWEYSVREGFQPFDDECQRNLELNYQAAMAGGPLQAQVKSGGRDVIADFGRMTQQVVGSDRTRKLRCRMAP